MVRRLTQEEIDRFGLIDAVAGDIATPEDLQKMMLPTLPKRETLAVDPEIEEITNQSLNVINRPVSVKNQPTVDQNIVQQNTAAGNKQLLDLFALMQKPQVPVDPFENLSKNQRRMLAFAGIRDAGMALQGKDSNAVSNLLGTFTEQADVARKARQAQMTQQLLSGMTQFGPQGTGEMPEDMSKIDMLKAQRDRILSQSFAIDPRFMPIVTTTINELNRQIADAEKKRQQDIDKATGAVTVLSTVDNLVTAIQDEGNMITGPIGAILGLMPFTKAGEARLTTETLRANLAFDTLRGIKAGGATLGSVSAPELALLEAKVANLNLNRSKEAVLASLKEIDRYYKQLVINAYKISDDPSQLDAIFGRRPAWADGEFLDMKRFEFNRTNVPEGELIVDRDGGNKVYRYIGGPRNLASSYEEVTF